MIKITHLHKKYGKKIAVNDLTLNIPKGCVYGLIGLNGAGKTTTLNSIATLILPTKGEIIVNKHNIKKEPGKVKQSIGLLPQDASFYNNRSVLSHMEYYARLKDTDIKEALEIIKKVGLDDVINTKISELSHGMKKYLSLGQALIGKPKVLLLDEPFSGLDPLIRNKMRNIIKDYAKNSTIIICSHDLIEIEKLCTKIGIINKGSLILEKKTINLKKSLEDVFLKAIKS